MIFQHTCDLVLDGLKTQTRRRVKEGETECRYRVGKTYAVQPGRTSKAVARIEVLRVWREDVRNISADDVLAEGYNPRTQFLRVWTDMHDPAFRWWWDEAEGCYFWWLRSRGFVLRSGDQGQFFAAMHKRPLHLYDAWAIEFKLED